MDDTRPQNHTPDRDEQPMTPATPTEPADRSSRADQDRPVLGQLTDPRALRMRTVVFGLVLALVAVSVVIAETTDLSVDGATVAIATLIGAGLLLFGGAMASLVRERRRN